MRFVNAGLDARVQRGQRRMFASILKNQTRSCSITVQQSEYTLHLSMPIETDPAGKRMFGMQSNHLLSMFVPTTKEKAKKIRTLSITACVIGMRLRTPWV